MINDLVTNNLFDFFVDPLGWDRDFYRFNRREKDMTPYSVVQNKAKGEAVITHNILGIDKKDLSIAIKPENGENYLVISGKTEDDRLGKTYTINSRFFVPDCYDIEHIEAEVKNGLVYITLPYKKEDPKKTKQVNIK